MKIFDLDGPFQYYGSMLFDLLVANLIWLFMTIFSFGFLSGPATLGLYQSVYHGILRKDGYVFKTYLNSLKKRFFFQLGFCLLYFVMLALSMVNLFLTYTGQFGTVWLLPVYFFLFLELCLIGTVALPLLSENRSLRMSDLLKVSFIIANKHLPWVFLASIPNILFVLIFILSFLYTPLSVLLFFVPALSAISVGQLVFKKILAQYNFFEQKDSSLQQN